MYKFFISCCFLFIFSYTYGQKEKNVNRKKDTTTYKTAYGLRVGIDLSKPTLTFIDKSYSGLELMGDYRISKNWYVATELGYEKETTFEDFTTSTAKGSYIRLGANYNAYQNWLDMNNEIFVGMRYGLALFDHSLDSYTVNVTTGVPNTPPYFTPPAIELNDTASGLTAHWIEVQLGLKVEALNNIFITAGASFKRMLSVTNQANFKTLYAPGFNRVFENNTGFGFFYGISYLIPFTHK